MYIKNTQTILFKLLYQTPPKNIPKPTTIAYHIKINESNLTIKANKFFFFLRNFQPIESTHEANNKLKIFYCYNILKIYNLEKKKKITLA